MEFPLGFFGEQGGETIHPDFKLFEKTNICTLIPQQQWRQFNSFVVCLVKGEGYLKVCVMGILTKEQG